MNETTTRTPIPPDHQIPAHAGEELHPARPKRRWIVWLLMLLIFGGVLWWVLHQKAGQPAAGAGGGRRGAAGGPVTAITATATQGDINVYQSAIGTVTPVYTASIVSQVTGVIQAVHYKEGQLVKKGQPLIDIDPRTYAATLKQAEGSLQRDENVLAQAKMDLQRYQTAWSRNAIAKQQLDDQEKLVLQDEGTVKNDEGTVDYDKVELSYCHIHSPITGRVGLRLVDPGNLVNAGGTTTLAIVTQLQPITVVFTVSEDNLQTVLSHMQNNQPLEVQALDRTQQKVIAKGKLLTTDNLIDTTTGTVKMRAGFDNKDTSLFPNQFVNTRLLVDTLRDVVLLPSSAIQHNGTQAFVWLVENGVANMRNVNTGASDDTQTQVTGINAGDVVANGSFEKLQPGAKVVPPSTGEPGQNGHTGGAKGAAGSTGPGGSGSGKSGSTAP